VRDSINFTKLTLDDIGRVGPFFAYSSSVICDHTVGVTFLWRNYFQTEYAIINETLLLKVAYNGGAAFAMPLGKDPHGGIRAIKEVCRANTLPAVFCMVTEDDIDLLKAHFDQMHIRREDDWSDYIYKASDLTALPGKKYHGQKNHINYFKKTFPDYSFEEITPANVEEIKTFFRRLNENGGKTGELYMEERKTVFEVLEHYGQYGLLGGLLRAGGGVVAFAVGETAKNVLYVHIEKADPRVRGAHQMICNEFAKYYTTGGIEYINREEDVGDEGLRKSKLSYHPCELAHKYVVAIPVGKWYSTLENVHKC
jgi:hypothetical protein